EHQADDDARTDDRRAAAIGLLVWTVLLAVALAVPQVRDTGQGRWLGSCVAGIVIGLVFLAYLHRRDRRASTRAAAPPPDAPAGGPGER
ncbi:hypothetical protein GTR02_19950, partial [Kineococcus sp. R8]|uniref:hypothetical protein n=1 Tax=Kineococcus siccus TaxID=2696567 RepID=UPI001412111E